MLVHVFVWVTLIMAVVAAFEELLSVYPNSLPMHMRGGAVFAESLRKQELWALQHNLAAANSTPNYFMQRVDHVNSNLGFFRQKFYVDTTFWTTDGPALLEVGGEGPHGSSPTGFIAEAARQLGAVMFTLEHRYYGESLPAPYTNKSMLQYLTVENALADLVRFMDYIDATWAKKQLVWVSVGGSYAGALSAWLKQRYPQRVAAAWSSSGVVNAIFHHASFDGHIQQVLSPMCRDAIAKVYRLASDMWDDPQQHAELLRKLEMPEYFTKSEMACLQTRRWLPYSIVRKVTCATLCSPVASTPSQTTSR